MKKTAKEVGLYNGYRMKCEMIFSDRKPNNLINMNISNHEDVEVTLGYAVITNNCDKNITQMLKARLL